MSAPQLLLALLVATLKAGLLLALAAVIVTALRRAPARARHGVWAGALVGALLMPALSLWLPEWRVAALPAPRLSATPSAPRLSTTPSAPRLSGTPSAPRSSAKPSAPTVDPEHGFGRDRPGTTPRGRLAPQSVTPAAVGGLETRPTAAAATPSRWDRLRNLSPVQWLLALWLLGSLASLAGFLRAFGSAGRLARRAVAADATWRRQLARARRVAGPRREVRLLVSAETATPLTWGWLRPVILLPERSSSWSAERRHVVLLHELAHVRRGDWLVRLVARVVCSLYWLNPLVWLAARRLAIEQEIACDEEVVALGTRASSYAGHLLAIARSIGPAAVTPAHALDMARRSQMEGRLMSILDERRRLHGGRKLMILAVLLLGGLIPALAAIEPWVEEPALPEPSASNQPTAGPTAGTATVGTATIGPATTGPAAAGTEGLARVLGEIEALERQMEPFQAELESLESEMRPIAQELEGIEVEMEPVEVELEGVEVALAPYEEAIERVEAEMQPHEARLEQIEAELRPFEEQLEGIETEMEPLIQELERLSEQMEPLAGDAGSGSVELEQVAARMQQVNERMEPLHERMGAIHEQMAPVFERMSEVHRQMEPLHERISGTHEQMEPVFERLAAAHERLAPFHQAMGEQHQRMEPYHRKMGEIHERMRPLHEEMGRRHEELRRQLVGVVERLLATELAEVTAAGTDYAPAAARIAAAVSLRVEGGTLRVQSSAAELRDILRETLGGQSVVAAEPFAAAVERLVRAVGDLEVEAR